MTIDRCECIVLSTMPYRESSIIATLLSRSHGRISGIAKGVRRPRGGLALERGQMVDLVLYLRPHRELQTLSQISVSHCYSGIRSDLGKLAIRDIALEFIIKTLTASECNPNHYDRTVRLLQCLEDAPCRPFPLPLLWHFLLDWSALLGFRLNLGECRRCKSARIINEGGVVSQEQDGLICTACDARGCQAPHYLSSQIICLASGRNRSHPVADKTGCLTSDELLRITHVLSAYIRYHSDIRSEMKSIAFLESILAT
ncbi:MAG: DNA repair protein RecO [Chitinispirillaceae bacterium]|nr:DNA repair protein RecO [Chitinispirillaceae bacterium]